MARCVIDDVTNLLVIGLDGERKAMLRRLCGADRCVFHPVFDREEVRDVEQFLVEAWLLEAKRRVGELDIVPDGIVNYWDFPIAEVAAVLAAHYGLRMASLESLVWVQHKYLARLLQCQIAPETVPGFEVVDVFDDDSIGGISLPFPFWLKPVRSYRSYLGFRIRSRRDLIYAVEQLRAGLPRLAEPYDEILGRVTLPESVAHVGGRWCVAEAIISGRQCTLEGWSHGGEIEVYGAIDSVRERNGSTFARYQYPSTLPRPVVARMADVATRFVERTGYSDAAFNAEFFWDRRRDRIWLLEVNARCSASHFDLFEQVDGRSHAQVLLDLSLGRRPRLPHREGEWPMAAKCFIREFADAVVTRAPRPGEIEAVEHSVPGTSVHLAIEKGDRLAELPDQDTYSYELGYVIVGGGNDREIRAKFRECHARLGLGLQYVAE